MMSCEQKIWVEQEMDLGMLVTWQTEVEVSSGCRTVCSGAAMTILSFIHHLDGRWSSQEKASRLKQENWG